MISYRNIQIQDLDAFIASDWFRNSSAIPMSSHRALSYIHNPRGDEADVVLITALEDERMLAYIGIFPDWIYLQKEDAHTKVGWLSCLWVDPVARGKGLARQLVNRALEAWDNRILITEYTSSAKGLYDTIGGLDVLTRVDGSRYYMYLDSAGILPKKLSWTGQIIPLLKFTDALVNSIQGLRLRIKANRSSKEIRVEEKLKIAEPEATFIGNYNQEGLFRRTAEELRWVQEYPWIREQKTKDPEALRYYFTSIEQNFGYANLSIYKEEKLIAWMMLEWRKNTLKVPYVFLEDNPAHAASAITDFMHKKGLRTLLVFDENLRKGLDALQFPWLHKRYAWREYIAHASLQEQMDADNILLRDGDGDSVFT